MDEWSPVITWLLIIVGWIVAYKIAKNIAKSNSDKSEITRKKQKISDLLDQIIEEYTKYVTESPSVGLARLIMYRLTSLGDIIENLGYDQTYSNQLQQNFIKLKQAITMGDDFMTESFTPHSDTADLDTAMTISREINDLLKKICT